MRYLIYKKLKFTLLFIPLGFPLISLAEGASLQKSVQSIDSIINAYYSVISGSKGFKYNPDSDQFLHAPNAIITRFNETGEFQRHMLSEEQKSLEQPYAEGFYEVETNRVVERYGNLAHVWSTYEMRESPDSKAFMRGINSISLYFKDNRWWIASWGTQYEGKEKIPAKYLPENHLSNKASGTP
tara:strand:+ start:116 stop:667 length:552 start_codon:yes stop_codon:yes gene_type:complete